MSKNIPGQDDTETLDQLKLEIRNIPTMTPGVETRRSLERTYGALTL